MTKKIIGLGEDYLTELALGEAAAALAPDWYTGYEGEDESDPWEDYKEGAESGRPEEEDIDESWNYYDEPKKTPTWGK